MADELNQIIAGIRSSYDKTNMRDLDLEDMLEIKPEQKVGYLLQNMEPESSKEYAINFDPVETLFLDNLVSEHTLNKRIIMDSEDFFRGIVFLDYLSNIVLNSTRIIDDLYEIAKDLERRDQDLDPDLGLVVRYSGMYYLYQSGREMARQRRLHGSRERYNQKNKAYEPEYVILRKISPVYESLGSMVCSLPKEDAIKEKLPDMLYLYDIKASIFIDSIVKVMEEQGEKDKIMERFNRGEIYEASIDAISALSKEITSGTFDNYVNSMLERNR